MIIGCRYSNVRYRLASVRFWMTHRLHIMQITDSEGSTPPCPHSCATKVMLNVNKST